MLYTEKEMLMKLYLGDPTPKKNGRSAVQGRGGPGKRILILTNSKRLRLKSEIHLHTCFMQTLPDVLGQSSLEGIDVCVPIHVGVEGLRPR